jgi:hypothetical protein
MRFSIFAAAVFAAVFMSGAAQAQANRFDGTWSVEIITERGECDKAYRYAIAIQDGRARYAGPEGFDISGSVSPNGAVTGSISRGQNRADVRGRLAGGMGSGTWTASGARNCSGRWLADKRS